MATDPLSGGLSQFAHARDIHQVGDVVRRVVRTLVGADGITFIIREGDHCYYAEEDAISPLWKGRRFPITQCVSGWAMLHRMPAVIPDIYDDPRVPIEAYRPTFVKSMAMFPIGSGEPFAAIGAYWASPHAATSSEMDMLAAVADSIDVNLRS